MVVNTASTEGHTTQTHLFVYFMVGRYRFANPPWKAIRQVPGWRQRLRLRWLLAVEFLLTEVIRLFSNCDLVHVCVGDARWVLNPMPDAARLAPTDLFILLYPALAWLVVVPVDRAVDLSAFTDERPIPVLPTALRWCTGGRWPQTRDCVQTVRQVLLAAGVDTEPRITTPAQLFDSLRSRGLHLVPLEEIDPGHTHEAERLARGI